MYGGEEAASIATALGIAVVSYFYWWKWSEARRRQRFKRGSGSLPSPMPVLPRWCGFVGGHTLLLEAGKVRDPCNSHAVLKPSELLYIRRTCSSWVLCGWNIISFPRLEFFRRVTS